MIKTILIYSLLDKCIDILFSKIELSFHPPEPICGIRVGDEFSWLVFNDYLEHCGVAAKRHAHSAKCKYYDVTITNIEDGIVSFTTKKAMFLYECHSKSDAIELIDIHDDYVIIDDTNIIYSYIKYEKLMPIDFALSRLLETGVRLSKNKT